MATETRNQKRPRKRRRGFALIFVLAFAAIVIVFTAAAGAQANFNLRMGNSRGQTDRAYYAANTGTQLILSLMREPPSDRDFDGDSVVGTWLGEDCSVSLSMLSTNADCFARVYHNIQGYGNAQDTAPDGTPIPKDCFYIVSLGVVNGEYDALGNIIGGFRQDQATMGATLAPRFPIMPHAAFAFDQLRIEGTVDHFNSAVSAWPWTPSGNRQFPEASVGTNEVVASAVSVTGTGDVNGNVLLGFGAPASELSALAGGLGTPPPTVAAAATAVNAFGRAGVDNYGNVANTVVSGRVDSLPAPKTIPNMDFDPARIEPPFPAGDVSAGVVRELEEGKIHRQIGDLVVNGGEIVVQDTNGDGIVEDAILLVDGDITFSSGRINHQLPPRRLKIYSSGPAGTTFTMNSGSEAFCLVAGLNLESTISTGATLWGAVLGDDITVQTGATVNFDVNLRDPNFLAGIYGFYLGTTTITPGVSLSPGALGPVGGGGGTTGTSGTGTSGTGTSGTGTSGTTTGGCGCGCGGGSMLAAVRKV
jgi:hypothetical protein